MNLLCKQILFLFCIIYISTCDAFTAQDSLQIIYKKQDLLLDQLTVLQQQKALLNERKKYDQEVCLDDADDVYNQMAITNNMRGLELLNQIIPSIEANRFSIQELAHEVHNIIDQMPQRNDQDDRIDELEQIQQELAQCGYNLGQIYRDCNDTGLYFFAQNDSYYAHTIKTIKQQLEHDVQKSDAIIALLGQWQCARYWLRQCAIMNYCNRSRLRDFDLDKMSAGHDGLKNLIISLNKFALTDHKKDPLLKQLIIKKAVSDKLLPKDIPAQDTQRRHTRTTVQKILLVSNPTPVDSKYDQDSLGRRKITHEASKQDGAFDQKPVRMIMSHRPPAGKRIIQELAIDQINE